MSRRVVVLLVSVLAALGCRDAFRAPDDGAGQAVDTPETGGILSMEAIRRWDAALRNVAVLAASNPAVGSAMRTRPDESPAAVAARLDTIPELRDAVARAGLGVTEYLAINTALYRALDTWYALQEGRITSLPDDANAADVAFVQQHDAEIRQLVARSRAQLAPLLPDSLRRQILE